MKLFSTTLLLLTGAMSALAATTPEFNQKRLDVLLKHKTKEIWNCSAGTKDAVLLFQVESEVGGMVSSTEALVIQDPQICSTLYVTCPYVAGAWGEGHNYNSSLGKYEDTVSFSSEGAGMKLVSYYGKTSWYFNPGECVKLD